ncbi:O-antigen ligase family protein [Clostridium lacusfryxellense]|uniref:O-antigen ligase family protein n=1 Tax=Clostridium lacusfryxellense TaxID=205328 RepID=UPI001C0E3CC3|nr:O-antigen ligase [Clostridium lacusfryxellense]MBU3111050.1 O-antigen ligase family protein [Clostridium lacusfryxellense]
MNNIEIKNKDCGVKINLFEKMYIITIFLMSTNAIIPAIRSQGGVEYDTVNGDIFMQMIWICIYLITVILIILKWERVKNKIFGNKWIGLLIIFAFLSIIWSASPAMTFRRCIALLFTQLIGTYLYAAYGLEGILDMLRWTFGLSIFLCLIFSIFFPLYGRHYDGIFDGVWKGIYTHKNSLGQFMVFSTTVWVISILDSLKTSKFRVCIYSIFTLLSVFLVLKSESKTSLVLIPIILSVIPVCLIIRRSLKLVIGISMTLIPISGYMFYLYFNNIQDLIVDMGKNMTLSGRTSIWEIVIQAIKMKPLFGYGYGAFWQGFKGPSEFICNTMGLNVPSAHNGYLNLTLELGCIGLFIFIISLITNLVQMLIIQRFYNNYIVMFPLICLMFIVFFNITESSITMQNTIYWIIYSIVCTSSDCEFKDMDISIRDLIWIGGTESVAKT